MTNEQFRKDLKFCIDRVRFEEINSQSSSSIEYDKYFTFRDYCQIKGLFYFVNNHKQLSCEEIEEKIQQNSKIFIFLSDFVLINKDILYKMNDYGLKYACVASRNQQIKNIKVQRRQKKMSQINDSEYGLK